MKLIAKTACLATVLSLTTAGCNRNAIEAVNLANEGDKAAKSSPDSAISKYQQAIQLDPSNHRILWKLARAYKKKEEWDKVAETCEKAERAESEGKKEGATHADYYFLHGYALAQKFEKDPGDWNEAKEPLEKAIQLDENLADSYFELAEVLLRLDDEQGALENYTKAIQKKPDEITFYGPLADLYIRLDYYDEAEQVAKSGLGFADSGDPNTYVLHSLLGQVSEIRGDMTGAIAEFESAKKACGKCNEKGQQIAYFNLGYAYSKAKPPRTNEAIQQLQAFQKTVCRGAGAKSFAEECSQAQEIVRQLGGG